MKKLELFWALRKPIVNFPFGYKHQIYTDMGMAGHNGLDLPCPIGEPIYASHDGLISFANIDGKSGYGVVIRTEEMFLDTAGTPQYFKTIYWHLLPNIPVRVGQKVMIGDIIGYGDTTGMATGPHLHFGLKPIAQGENEWTWYNIEQNNGYFGAIDPEPYMSTMTAFQLRTSLQTLSELIKKLSELLAVFIKGRNNNSG